MVRLVTDGVLVVNKPAGPTSHDVVATARRTLRIKRVGHTGTLDPNASGVLPLVLGSATRLAQYFSGTDKEYDATIRFGVESDTYDAAGEVVRETGLVPSEEALVAALAAFRGAFAQTPPAFSAKKIEGDRAYALARRAREVVLTPVPVVVHALDLVSYTPPQAVLRVVCSAGFYVRSLAHDLGRAVATGALLEALVRRRAGTFSLEQAVPFGDVAAGRDGVIERVIPMEGLLLDFPAVHLTPEGVRRVGHGQDLRPVDWSGSVHPLGGKSRLLDPDGRFIALAEPAKDPGLLHPAVVFR